MDGVLVSSPRKARSKHLGSTQPKNTWQPGFLDEFGILLKHCYQWTIMNLQKGPFFGFTHPCFGVQRVQLGPGTMRVGAGLTIGTSHEPETAAAAVNMGGPGVARGDRGERISPLRISRVSAAPLKKWDTMKINSTNCSFLMVGDSWPPWSEVDGWFVSRDNQTPAHFQRNSRGNPAC